MDPHPLAKSYLMNIFIMSSIVIAFAAASPTAEQMPRMPVSHMPKAEGAACWKKNPCEWGYTCLQGRCIATIGEGEKCRKFARCAPGLKCSDGVCMSPAGMGGSCKTNSCRTGLTCDDQVCVYIAQRARECGYEFTFCENGHACRYRAGRPVCVRLVQLGAPCHLPYVGCEAGLRCRYRNKAGYCVKKED